jgi:hypothetical protein
MKPGQNVWASEMDDSASDERSILNASEMRGSMAYEAKTGYEG